MEQIPIIIVNQCKRETSSIIAFNDLGRKVSRENPKMLIQVDINSYYYYNRGSMFVATRIGEWSRRGWYWFFINSNNIMETYSFPDMTLYDVWQVLRTKYKANPQFSIAFNQFV